MTQLQIIAQTTNDLIDIAEIASLRTRIDDNKIKPFMSHSKALKKYGKDLRIWLEAGLIKGEKGTGRNATIWYDILRLEALSKSTNKLRRTKI